MGEKSTVTITCDYIISFNFSYVLDLLHKQLLYLPKILMCHFMLQ